jgi:hypothetical protein
LGKELNSDLVALKKGWKIAADEGVQALSFCLYQGRFYYTGIVDAEMRKHCSYNIRIVVEETTADVMNAHCECPAGKGPTATCKHVVCVLHVLADFVSTGKLDIEGSCTDQLQAFKKPKKAYSGKPVPAEEFGQGNFKYNVKFVTLLRQMGTRSTAFSSPEWCRHLKSEYSEYCRTHFKFRMGPPLSALSPNIDLTAGIVACTYVDLNLSFSFQASKMMMTRDQLSSVIEAVTLQTCTTQPSTLPACLVSMLPGVTHFLGLTCNMPWPTTII